MADQDFNINIRTTADLAGARQAESTLSELQRRAAQIGPGAALAERDAAGAAGAGGAAGDVDPLLGKLGHGFERIAIHAAGIGAVLGAIEEIKRFAEEINKITEALDKQGEALVRNVQLMSEEAGSATTVADVIKVAETGLKGQAEQHKVVEQLQQKELSWYEKIWDAVGKIGELKDEEGDAQKIINEAVESATELEEKQRQAAVRTIQTAKGLEEAFDRRKAQPLDEVIQELTKHVADLENRLKGIDASKYPLSWIETAKAIEQAKKELLEFLEIQKRGETGGPGGTSIIKPAQPPRTVAEFRDDFAEATADFNKQFGPQAIQDFRDKQQKATEEFTGQTPRFGGSSANDVLTTLKDQNALMKQLIDAWK